MWECSPKWIASAPASSTSFATSSGRIVSSVQTAYTPISMTSSSWSGANVQAPENVVDLADRTVPGEPGGAREPGRDEVLVADRSLDRVPDRGVVLGVDEQRR